MYIAQRLSQYLIMEEDYVGPIALYSISTVHMYLYSSEDKS